MAIDTSLVAQLRKETGAGIVDCKKALDVAQGDMQKAKQWLAEQGITKAAKKQDRSTAEGIVNAYIHSNKKVGVLLMLLCETDFVGRNEAFKALADDICMHIAAANPVYLSSQDVPQQEINAQKEIYKAELQGQNKPQEIQDKIIEGKIQKYFEEICLLNQPFIKDEDITIRELIAQKTTVIGEKIEIGKFVRYEIAS